MSDLRIDSILIELTKRYGVDCKALEGGNLVQLNVDNYNNSTGDLNTKDGYNCPLCKNKGYIAFVNDNDLEAHTPCKCQKVREVLRRANKSGLGEVLSEKTFDQYEAAEEHAPEYLRSSQAERVRGEKQEEQSGESSVEAEIQKAEAGIVVKSYT